VSLCAKEGIVITIYLIVVLKVFLFSTNCSNWKYYNWTKLTTLVEVGYHDAEMVKYAHSQNVTVSYIGTTATL